MKIKSMSLRNYKRFVEGKEISFCDPDGAINDVTLITGDNGTGKTSVLQAIVTLVGSAARENFNMEELDWPGFEYRHLQTGRTPLLLEAKVVFDTNELKAIESFANQLSAERENFYIPDSRSEVNLNLDYERQKVVAREGASAYFQFKGYQYAKQLAPRTPNKTALFENVGNIYWYTEQRNSYSFSKMLDNETPQIDFIRNFLASTYNYNQAVRRGDREIQEGEFDFYAKLESLYRSIFPSRSFVGTAPRFDVFENSRAPDFFLSDGRNQYELSEMSAGERAIFPMLMDFARWNINNSVIIIDEIELHLHPPLQQALVRALPRLGNNNQFIITSHSDTVAVMFDESENQIIRMT